ncbi:uncharacterized protein L203_101531 [Cryptococcus depauperatus CBS 7841]|uniref:Cyclin-D1-binding protein 1-like N-terminal domain-containing protein n=1 Tax=Cryptococcus depauperatus CBS 7841 TaxID=1295531 RepID=A0AAJ8JQ62_9TREE
MLDQQLKEALHNCRLTCHNALNSMASTQSSIGMLPEIGAAFNQLLANLRQSFTSLGIAFKPPVTIPAAIQQLEKITQQMEQLVSCVLIVRGELHQEWNLGLSTIEAELERHLDVLEGEGDYLPSTGMVWEAIDRLARDLSKDEKSAVLKKWKLHQNTVEDAWQEFKDLLECKGENDDGGWDELGLGEEPLSDEERYRAETLLHASIPRYLDQYQHDFQPLITLSATFVSDYDDAVSAMHSKQDEKDIDIALNKLEETSTQLANKFRKQSIEKWKERYDQEKGKWSNRKFDMSSLVAAIE